MQKIRVARIVMNDGTVIPRAWVAGARTGRGHKVELFAVPLDGSGGRWIDIADIWTMQFWSEPAG